MPSYDTTFYSPPVPAVEVKLHNPRTGITLSNVLMILDTGADASFIPRFAVEALELSPVSGKTYEISSYDGTIHTSSAVRLEILFEGRKFRGHYLVVDHSIGFIGRDILNLLRIELDGPLRIWTILPKRQ